MQVILISNNLIVWLQEYLKERLCDDIYISLDGDKKNWKLSLKGSDNYLKVPVFEKLYKVGLQTDLEHQYLLINEFKENFYEDGLHAPGLSSELESIFEKKNNTLFLHYDVFGMIYWMLSRCEEIDVPNDKLDIHKRFSAKLSHSYKNKYIERPIVDEWIYYLRFILKFIWENVVFKKEIFKLEVSHDVDRPSAYGFGRKRDLIKQMGISVIRRKDLVSAFQAPFIYYSSRKKLNDNDPYVTFNWLMRLSEEQNIKSTFYFLSGKTSDRYDGNYELNHPAITDLLRTIKRREHLIGLHPSYETFNKPKLMLEEANKLIKICADEKIIQESWGVRMHYLRWGWPITAYAIESAKLDFDTTLSYADKSGFRCGTCHHFKMFDPKEQRSIDLRQHPLIVMECSVLGYEGYGISEEAFLLMNKLKQRCKNVNGCFTLLWHNSSFTSVCEKELYKRIISC